MAADTRATEGPIVADKNCEKIHYIRPNMYCCGAGTAADTEFTTSMISHSLGLHALNRGRGGGEGEVRVVTAMTMLKQYLFRYQGHVGAALILGGGDGVAGAQLYTIYPHGSVDRLPFTAMGSGSLAAMAVLEAGWHPELDQTAAIELCSQAILAGIFNDLGSGSNVDLTILHTNGQPATILRNHLQPNERPPKQRSYRFPAGSCVILSEQIYPHTKPASTSSITPAVSAMEI